MEYQSTRSQSFRDTVQHWIQEHGEVLVLFRFHASAGSKSWEFFASVLALQSRIEGLSPQTSVIILREHEVRLKGVVDDDFIVRVVNQYPTGEWWLIACMEQTKAGRASWYHSIEVNDPTELENELRSEFCFGKPVAVGREPEWIEERDGLVSAVVPFEDGTVKAGVY